MELKFRLTYRKIEIQSACSINIKIVITVRVLTQITFLSNGSKHCNSPNENHLHIKARKEVKTRNLYRKKEK
jgi:hypothetical protein